MNNSKTLINSVETAAIYKKKNEEEGCKSTEGSEMGLIPHSQLAGVVSQCAGAISTGITC